MLLIQLLGLLLLQGRVDGMHEGLATHPKHSHPHRDNGTYSGGIEVKTTFALVIISWGATDTTGVIEVKPYVTQCPARVSNQVDAASSLGRCRVNQASLLQGRACSIPKPKIIRKEGRGFRERRAGGAPDCTLHI